LEYPANQNLAIPTTVCARCHSSFRKGSNKTKIAEKQMTHILSITLAKTIEARKSHNHHQSDTTEFRMRVEFSDNDKIIRLVFQGHSLFWRKRNKNELEIMSEEEIAREKE
jgi:hypothetical protein